MTFSNALNCQAGCLGCRRVESSPFATTHYVFEPAGQQLLDDELAITQQRLRIGYNSARKSIDKMTANIVRGPTAKAVRDTPGTPLRVRFSN